MKNNRYILIAIILLIFFGLFCIRLNEPFFGHFEGGQLWIASSFRTFNLFGMDAVHYLPIRTEGPTDPVTGEYYLHHPPLIVWITAAGNWLFGYEQDTGMVFEMSQRLVAIFFTMTSLSLIYALARRLSKNSIVALLAMVFYGFTPMTIYYSRTPYYDMLVMPFILLYAYVFIGWMENFSKSRAYFLMFLAVLMMWIAWVAAFFLTTLAIVCLIYGTKQQRIYMVFIGIVTVCATALVPTLYEFLMPGALAELANSFVFRMGANVSEVTDEQFTTARFLLSWFIDMVRIVTLSLSGLGLWGIIWFGRKAKPLYAAVLYALLAAPFIFMILFRNAFYVHDWYEMHYMPALAIGAGWVGCYVWQIEPKGLKIYSKPFFVAIVICSVLVTIYWSYDLHQRTLSPFARALAAELPLATNEDDKIVFQYTQPYYEVNYYAYRTIIWIGGDATVEELREAGISYYVLCFDNADLLTSYDGDYESLPYTILAERCRLIDVQGESE